MDNPEQYLLQVLHRTETGLQDSLIPFHAGKMQRLAERLDQAASLKDELLRLQTVYGFTKAALSMQWVMERVERSGEDFSPDQFDIDATLLSDKLFEAFLSEPFDVPADVSTAVEPPAAGATEEVPVAEQPYLSGELLQDSPSVEETSAGISADVPAQEAVHEEPPVAAEPPALSELLDNNLLLGFQRFTEIVSKLGEKTPSERKSVFAVLAMIAKSSADVARAQGKTDILEFFQSVLKFIAYVDSSGSAQDSRIADIMREVGERLSKALTERSDGAELLKSINQILQNPESVLKP
ncbi:MAG TPA: hypothetical protein VMM58_14100 [Bacteroidota bacterium]|nr:hypothetical protein [Bacteroidota bacterium]